MKRKHKARFFDLFKQLKVTEIVQRFYHICILVKNIQRPYSPTMMTTSLFDENCFDHIREVRG